MDNLQAGAVLIGVVNGVRLLYPKLTSGQSFLLNLACGLGMGYAHLFGLNLETGLVTALMSSGLYQVAKKVGGN